MPMSSSDFKPRNPSYPSQEVKDKSIMTAYIPATETFKIYYEDYMNELFNPSMGFMEDVFDEEFY